MAYEQPKDFGYAQTTAPGGGGGGGSLWTDVTLSGGSLVQDPAGIISGSSYGATSSVTFGVGDPGNIRGPTGPAYVPDCPIWEWPIAAPFSFTDNAQVLVQLKITGTPNDAYLLYLGVYDGTLSIDQGLYGSIGVTTGATGVERIGRTPANGNAAASIVANGGSVNFACNVDADFSRCRDVLVRTDSATGPAYGQQVGAKNATAWTGTTLKGFLAIGATASKGGGTFPGIQLRYAVIPTYA
jgi:hypothetical protein